LAGLPDNAYYLGRYVFAGDDSCYAGVMRCALLDLSIVAEINHWRFKKEDTLFRLIKLGLYEIAQERLCPDCQGKEWFSHNCPTCEGSGRQPLSGYARAKFISMDRKLWSRIWSKRYEQHVFRYFLALQHTVYWHVREKLRS